MPVIVNVDGTKKVLVSAHTDLKSLQAMVGGLIQMVELPKGELLMCNEEGKIRGMAVNSAATTIWWDKTGHPVSDVLVGPVVFFTAKEARKLK
jgi:hypothetical protein